MPRVQSILGEILLWSNLKLVTAGVKCRTPFAWAHWERMKPGRKCSSGQVVQIDVESASSIPVPPFGGNWEGSFRGGELSCLLVIGTGQDGQTPRGGTLTGKVPLSRFRLR